MKSIALVALAAIMALLVVGCGSKPGTVTTTDTISTSGVQPNNTDTIQQSGQVENSVPASTVDPNSGEAQLLAHLENAYNSQDIYGIVECFDPSVANASFAVMKLMGIDADSYKSAVPFASKVIGQSGTMGDWGEVTLTALALNGDSFNKSLTYQVDLAYTDGSANSFEDTANIVQIDGVWYFSAFQPVNAVAVDYGPIPVNSDITEDDVKGDLFIIGNQTFGPLGYINESGKEIVSPYFRNMQGFKGDYCAVSVDGSKWGIIDRMGNLVVDYIFTEVKDYPSHNGWFSVQNESGWGAINPTTGEAIGCGYSDIGAVGKNGLVPVSLNGYWGVATAEGSAVTDYLYSKAAASYRMDLLGVAINNAWGVIDGSGNYVLQPAANRTELEISNSGLIFAKDQGRYSSTTIYDSNANILFADVNSYEFLADGKILITTTHDADYAYGPIDNNWSRSVVLDENGNILMDSDKIATQYFAAHPDEVDDRHFNYGSITTPGYTDGIFEISVHGTSIYLNVSDYDGNFLLNEWFSADSSGTRSLSISDNKTTLYAGSEYGKTDIFDLESGNKVAELPFTIFHVKQFGNTALCEGRKDGRDFDIIIDASNENYTNYQEYKDIALYMNSSLWNKEYPIVTDGVFYGLYGPNGFIGRGLNYSSVEWDQDNWIYTLRYGADVEQYRIGVDGTVNQLQ